MVTAGVEDAHWSDPTTLTLVERLLARIESRSALVLISHRPEFSKTWGERAQATAITCKPLGNDQCVALARRAAGGRLLDEALIQEIVKRSDGVPLYVEELTKAVMDMQAAHAVVVPSTLRDSLMARLDRLGAAKEVALVASVIGRHFSYPQLAAIAGVPEPALQAALERLRGAGLVFAAGESLDGSYSFNHSLVQEAAYESLSRSRRQALHLATAEALEAQHDTPAASAPEIVAHHFELAAHLHAGVHFRLEEAESAAAVGLCVVHRHVGITHQLARFNGIHRRNRDADADVGDDLMAIDLVGFDHRFADALRERGAVRGRTV